MNDTTNTTAEPGFRPRTFHPTPVELAEARHAIEAAPSGLGSGGYMSAGSHFDYGPPVSTLANNADFVAAVADSIAYLREQPARRKRSSYGLKHNAERWAGSYVPNGAMLVALHALGYRLRQYSGQSPNAEVMRRPPSNSPKPDTRIST